MLKLTILLSSLLAISCAESDFEASSGTTKLAPESGGGNNGEFGNNESGEGFGNGTSFGGGTPEGSAGRLTIEDDSTTYCANDGEKKLSVNLSGGDSGSDDRGPDIRESAVMTFSIAGSKGNILNITSYSQDDIAMIVPAKYSLADIHKGNRVFDIPESGFLLDDPVNGVKGAVNSKRATTYNFPGQPSHYIPGGGSTTVSALGMPMVAQNNIKLSRFDHPDYKDANGNIALKVMLVMHEYGHINLTAQIPQCD